MTDTHDRAQHCVLLLIIVGILQQILSKVIVGQKVCSFKMYCFPNRLIVENLENTMKLPKVKVNHQPLSSNNHC
jgi:hypothetical protein